MFLNVRTAAAHLFTGLSPERPFMLELIVKIEETEAKGVWRGIKGHLHVQTVLSDVQVPRLPDWEEEGPE